MKIREAVNKAGGATQVAKKLGISRQAVFWWCKRGLVGSTHAWQLAQMADIDPYVIRPDIFPAPQKNAPV